MWHTPELISVMLIGLLFGAIVLLFGGAIAFGSSGFDGMGDLRGFIVLAGLVFVGNVLAAVIGVSIGNAVANRNPPRHDPVRRERSPLC